MTKIPQEFPQFQRMNYLWNMANVGNLVDFIVLNVRKDKKYPNENM